GADPRCHLVDAGNAPPRGTDDLHSRRIPIEGKHHVHCRHRSIRSPRPARRRSTPRRRNVARSDRGHRPRRWQTHRPRAERGTVRRADFADPITLNEAFAGAEAMVLVSTTTVEERFDNARNAIDAAARAGVSRIVYTSIVNASTARMTLADAHRRTEDYLRDS